MTEYLLLETTEVIHSCRPGYTESNQYVSLNDYMDNKALHEWMYEHGVSFERFIDALIFQPIH